MIPVSWSQQDYKVIFQYFWISLELKVFEYHIDLADSLKNVSVCSTRMYVFHIAMLFYCIERLKILKDQIIIQFCKIEFVIDGLGQANCISSIFECFFQFFIYLCFFNHLFQQNISSPVIRYMRFSSIFFKEKKYLCTYNPW